MWIYSVLGLWVYDVPTGRWRDDLAAPWKHQTDFVHAMAQDKTGRIWLAKEYKGIDVFDKKTGEVVNLTNHEDDERSLCHNTVYQLYVDRNGLVWAGTYKKGISYYGESIFKFNFQSLGDITCIEQEDAQRLWLGTNDDGLLLWNIQTRKFEEYGSRRMGSNPIVTLLKTRDGKLWAGTFNGGLYCLDKGNIIRYTMVDGLSSNNVWDLVEDREGNLWIGYLDAGLQCFHPQTGEMETYTTANSDLPDNLINSQPD